jgi:hypothetical protein
LASSCCESDVEPTRSQKRTVSWLRSPGCATSASRDGSAGAPDACSPFATGVLHARQNFAVARSSAWQLGQRSTSDPPHSRQNLAPYGFSWPQEEQGITSRLACAAYHIPRGRPTAWDTDADDLPATATRRSQGRRQRCQRRLAEHAFPRQGEPFRSRTPQSESESTAIRVLELTNELQSRSVQQSS